MPLSKEFSRNQELLDLMKAANEHLDGVCTAHSRSIDQAIKCGKALEAAKDIVGHGKWCNFVRDNFNGSRRTAQRYMNVRRAIASGSVDLKKKTYETLSELEADIPRDTGSEIEDEIEDQIEDEIEDEAELPGEPPSAPKPSKKKDVDQLTAALKAIGKAINSVQGEKKIEWAKLLRAEIDLYMGPFEASRKQDAINETADALDQKRYGDAHPFDVEGEEL